MIRWLLAGYLRHIEHLEDEVEWYRVQLTLERRRAEQAVDTLLHMHAMPSVTPPPARDAKADADAEIKRVLEGTEWAQVGMPTE